MKAVAMRFREKKFRAFYRICILPEHIAKRKGAVKKAMEAELAEHRENVENSGLAAELKAYQTARDLRQSTYDAMCAANAEANQNPSEAAGTKAAEALAAFEQAKSAFMAAYQ